MDDTELAEIKEQPQTEPTITEETAAVEIADEPEPTQESGRLPKLPKRLSRRRH